MNKVFLSGMIAEAPTSFSREDAVKHVRFPLSVRHRTKHGTVKRELYTVHAWNGVAEWAQAFLRQGQRVMIQGYLTQHGVAQADGSVRMLAEVTAEEFFAAMLKGEDPRAEGEEDRDGACAPAEGATA